MSSLKPRFSKTTAILLAVVMLVTAIPVSLFTAFAAPEETFITVTVKNETTDEVIENASVELGLPAAEETYFTAKTDANGVAKFSLAPIEEYLATKELADVVLTCRVLELTGYDVSLAIGNINYEAGAGNTALEIKVKPIDKITLSGKVTNEKDEAYQGATVKLEGYVGATAETDAEGNYSFEVYKGKDYTVTATPKEDKYLSDSIAITAPEADTAVDTLKFEIKTYELTAEVGANGTLDPVGTETVEWGTEKTFTATPDAFYCIESIKVNDIEIPGVAGKNAAHTFDVTVTDNTAVVVSFMRYSYTINFTVSENGDVAYNDGSEQKVAGGSIDVKKEVAIANGPITVTATPAENFRVSKVTVDGGESSFTENDKVFAQEFAIDKDHTFVVEFAINRFDVTVADCENGKAYFESEDQKKVNIEYNSSAKLTIVPDAGYAIETVTVNGVDKKADLKDENGFSLNVLNVTENTEIAVTFAKPEVVAPTDKLANEYYTIELSAPEAAESYMDGEYKVIVLPHDATATIKPVAPYTGIKINSDAPYGEYVESIVIDETTDIENIFVENGITADAIKNATVKVRILIDKEAPVLGAVENQPWTNLDVTVEGTVTDGTASSGLDYVVWSKTALDNAAVLAETANKTAIDAKGEYEFKIYAKDNDQNQKYNIYAVDKAGNVSAAEEVEIQIDGTEPVVTKFDFSKVENSALEEAISFLTFGTFFPETVQVEITVTDPATNEVFSGTKIVTLYANGELVEAKEVNAGVATFLLEEAKFINAEISATVEDVAGNISAETKPSDVDTNAQSNQLYINSGALTSAKVEKVETSVTAEGENLRFDAADSTVWYANKKVVLNLELIDAVVGLQKAFVTVNGKEVTEIAELNAALAAAKVTDLQKVDLALADYLQEGKNVVEVYVLNNANVVSEKSEYTFNVDMTVPSVTDIKIDVKGESTVEKVINFLTFGIFCNCEIEIEVNTAEPNETAEANSGVEHINLYYGEKKLEGTVEEGKAIFTLPEEFDGTKEYNDFLGTLSVEVIDYVGNTVKKTVSEFEFTDEDGKPKYPHSDLKVETIKPVVVVTGNEVIENNDRDASGTSFGDATITFTVQDEQSGLASVQLFVNGEEYTDRITTEETPTEFPQEKFPASVTDEYTYTFTTEGIEPDVEGDYVINVVAVDNAGNVEGNKENKKEEATYVVEKDNTAPYITGFQFAVTDDTVALEEVASIEDYGYYFKETVEVTITAKDERINAESKEVVAGVDSITVVLKDSKGNLYDVNYDPIESVAEAVATSTAVEEGGKLTNKDQITFTIEKDFKGQIFAFATDRDGNTPHFDGVNFKYMPDHEDEEQEAELNALGVVVAESDALYLFQRPNGSILESPEKHAEDEHIIFEVPTTPYKDKNGTDLYNDDVEVELTITDNYSGIREVEWQVVGHDSSKAQNQSGKVVVDNDGVLDVEPGDNADAWTKTMEQNLVTVLKRTITVDNDSNGIVVKARMTDRAGNCVIDGVTDEEGWQYITFSIDKTAPTIKVSYDKNTPDTKYTEFFKEDRTAEIVITERNFDPADVVITVTKDGVKIPVAVTWTTAEDKNTPNNTTHTAKIVYDTDGDYTFAIECVDLAKNANNGVTYADGTVSPEVFTIDKTLPVVTVTFNNNAAQNGNYFKADRTATITVVEHNFDAERFVLLEKTPALSAWRNTAPDTYVATINYNTDARYTLDFELMDMAANAIADFAPVTFVIDKTNPVLQITGIVDQSANNSAGDIGFVVTATDENYNGFRPVLTAIVMKDGSFESRNLEIGKTENIAKGQRYVVTNIDQDGIYSITCTLVDKAGNAYSEVILQDAEGRNYTEKRSGEDKLVTFSVNRDGSVFMLNDFTNDLVKTYYVKNVDENVTIIEINADPILENKVTLNGKELVENKDYKVSLDSGSASWYKYSYSINKSLFDGESEYNLVVSSKDKATNEAFSDVKNLTVKFVVDRTAPIVTVAGLKKDGRYQVETQVVTLNPADDGGSLKSLIVRTLDEDGKVLKELINLSGDELVAALEAGSITFELGEGLYQNVQIICEDYAGNVMGTEDNEVYTNVSISTSAFMIFWANKTARWLTIGGIALFIAALVTFIVLKKKRKNKAEK